MLVRAHETQMDGFGVHSDGKGITIFSAPCYENSDNLGAAMIINSSGKYSFILFEKQ